MNAARWQQIKSVFGDVLELAPALRPAYIEDLGMTDPDLRQRVASLLSAHELEGDEFLRTPAVDLEIYRDLIDIHVDPWLDKQVGPYRLVQQLGSGGMGEVYLAVRDDAQFDQRVAIKLIRSGQESAAVVSRFKAERQILAGLDHPNIAKLLDGGRTPQGRPYFVMEYVPGPPITVYCEDKALNVRDRLELFIQACDGVQHAHQNAIIHRDLKPSNILVLEVDGKPVCRIIDFGLAKTAVPMSIDQTQLTKLGIFMGTPGYMSPEQADFSVRNIDTRADVYSLGAILYALLTGAHPFESVGRGLAFDEWLRRLREDSPLRPSARRNAAHGPLPADLDWITMKALERDRERRYGTPAELVADLRRFLAHEPVLARPPSTAYQVRMFVRRHRVEVSSVAAVVLALVAGLSIALWQARAAGVAARQARAQELDASARAVKLRQMSALSAEQSGDAAGLLGFASVAVARLAYAVRLDPQNATLRSHLLQLLDEQDIWWLPVGQAMHHSKVQMVKFSPDGARFATASEDGSVLIWNAVDGHLIGSEIKHQGAIFSLRFSPDGRRLVTGSADHTARVWDASTGEPAGPLLRQNGEINDAAFSHDGERVVTAGADHSARVWDWRVGRALGAALRHGGAVDAVEFSPDDTRVATASEDHTARIWDARSGRPLGSVMQHQASVHQVEFSADGTRLLTASQDSTARVWDAATGKLVGKPMKHTWVVRYAHFNADGSRVITSSWDRTARIWDARTGDPLGDSMEVALQAVAAFFSGDGEIAYTVVQDGTVRAWNGRSGKPRGALVRLTSAEIVDADLDAQSNRLVTAARDGTLQIWERRSSAKLRDPLRQDDKFKFMRFSPDGRRVITDSADHTATIWNVAGGTPALAPLRHTSEVEWAGFSVDGTRIVTIAADHNAQIWNASTGEAVGRLMRHPREPAGAKFSPDGTLVLTSLGDGSVFLWDAATGLAHGAPLHTGSPNTRLMQADFSSDGALVAAAVNDKKSNGGTVYVWNTGTGLPLGSPITLRTDVRDWHFSPDGTRIATVSAPLASLAIAGEARTVQLWDVRTSAPLSAPVTYGGELVPPLQFTLDGKYILIGAMEANVPVWDAFSGTAVDWAITHEAGVTEVQVSPDGSRFVTASMDQTARVWDARTGAAIGTPLRHDGVIWTARFSTDGKLIATASGDRTAQIWDADTHVPVTGPLHHEWPVRFALLSADSGHVITINVARDRTRVWPIFRVRQSEAMALVNLAEAVGGYRIGDDGMLIPTPDRARAIETLRIQFAEAAISDLDRVVGDLVREPSRATPH